MAAKSDFAQKLLNDLRVRKEKMAAAHNSSRQSTQASRVANGNTGQTSRGSRQINTLESASSRAGNTSRRSNISSNRSTHTKEPSNQIVLYGSEQSSRQVQDLSMAIAFAFESSKNLSNAGASTTTNPLVNFFNRFGRRSRDNHKMDITTTFDKTRFPTVSNVHITEVSKGVQKLNQILRACSNGFSFDANSIEIGKELLKGAVDLEESLRMLVNLQEASEYANGGQKKKSQLKLIEEDEDDRDDDAKIVDQWKLGRPQFSFDKPSRSSHAVQSATQMVTHKRSTSYDQDLSLSISTQVRQSRNSSSSGPTQEKRRISNVVAKLMGLEELPQNEDFVLKKNDAKGKQGNVSKQNTNLPNRVNQVNVYQSFNDSKRKQSPTGDKQRKITESESRTLVLNTEQPQKGQNGKSLKGVDKTHDRIGYKSGANSTEKRNVDKNPPRNQQKPHEQRVLIQEHVLKRGENLMAENRKGRQAEPIIPPKSKKSTAVKKKLSHDKSTPNRTHQHDAPMINISQQTAPNKENVKKEDQIHSSSTREPRSDMESENKNPVPIKEKPVEASAKQKALIPKKVQRSEMIPKKIDILMSRRNADANHLTRSIKHPTHMLKDLKQQMHKKNRTGKRTEEQSDSKVMDENAGISVYNALEKKIIEPVKQQDKLQNEDEQSIVLNSFAADENQIPNVQNTRTLNDSCDTIELNSEKVRIVEQPYALEDEQELIQCDQSTGDHEQDIKNHYPFQHVNKQMQEQQLTEPEKQLKEIVIKSQTFLSTSEALFKLNIPVSFLHDDEVANNKLVLNCAYEVMKRKARRHENTYNYPYTKKITISRAKAIQSLDDLIRQLCMDIERLKSYGGNGDGECDVATSLWKMLEKDIYGTGCDVNSMWDFEWSNNVTSLVTEKEDVVREVERYLLNGLLDEVTDDVVVLAVSV